MSSGFAGSTNFMFRTRHFISDPNRLSTDNDTRTTSRTTIPFLRTVDVETLRPSQSTLHSRVFLSFSGSVGLLSSTANLRRPSSNAAMRTPSSISPSSVRIRDSPISSLTVTGDLYVSDIMRACKPLDRLSSPLLQPVIIQLTNKSKITGITQEIPCCEKCFKVRWILTPPLLFPPAKRGGGFRVFSHFCKAGGRLLCVFSTPAERGGGFCFFPFLQSGGEAELYSSSQSREDVGLIQRNLLCIPI